MIRSPLPPPLNVMLGTSFANYQAGNTSLTSYIHMYIHSYFILAKFEVPQ